MHGELFIIAPECMPLPKNFNLYHMFWRAKESPDAIGEGQHSALQDYIEPPQMFQYNNH